MDITKLREELLEFIKEKAFSRKKVILASGKESDYYIDLRKISLSAKGSFLIANLLWAKLKEFNVKAIGGPTLGADPILSALAYHAYLQGETIDTFIIRKSPKKHGTMSLLEGPDLVSGQEVILIDDVATTGGSIIDSVSKLESYSIKPVACFVVVDRQEEAEQNLKKINLPLISLFKLSEIV